MSAICNIADYSNSTKLLAATTLRNILGTKNLSEILSDREFIARDVLQHLDIATDPWGIKVMVYNNNIGSKILENVSLNRWKEWRSRMFACLNNFNVPWLLKRRQQERQKLK